MRRELDQDTDFQKLVNSSTPPDFAKVLLLAKKFKITDPANLWEMLDYVRKCWSENKAYDGDWSSLS